MNKKPINSKEPTIEITIDPATLEELAIDLLDLVTGGDFWDCIAGDLTTARGHAIPGLQQTPKTEDCIAYDVAFFDLIEIATKIMRNRWGGYYGTFRQADAVPLR